MGFFKQLKGNLNALCINDKEISNVYFFVIGRYNTHFSNQKNDERAAWGSWYHLVELYHKIKIEFDDPIKELYFKLKADSPRNTSIKNEIDENPKLELNNFSITFTNV